MTPRGTTVARVIRARAASLGLVAALGFLLLVSLVVSALVTALSDYIDTYLPFGHLVLRFRTSGNRNPNLILIRCRDH